ncbi:MAG: DNA-binding GntR family transcriptional regulator [Gammaproteobacteria bacterium]|jgi:DNA-binding GntR family transcriptional regulator
MTTSGPTENREPTRREQALEQLRSAILDGHFKTGQKLVERELCELTGASRSVLREALANLEANGLVESESYRGYRVAQLSPHKIYEIFELRSALETLAAELFAERASAAELVELADVLRALENSVANFELTEMRKIKERYYELLFRGCRNDEIRGALETIINRVFYLRSYLMTNPARRAASLKEMRTLTRALLARDRLAARAATLAHLEAARDAVLEGIEKSTPGRGDSA